MHTKYQIENNRSSHITYSTRWIKTLTRFILNYGRPHPFVRLLHFLESTRLSLIGLLNSQFGQKTAPYCWTIKIPTLWPCLHLLCGFSILKERWITEGTSSIKECSCNPGSLKLHSAKLLLKKLVGEKWLKNVKLKKDSVWQNNI